MTVGCLESTDAMSSTKRLTSADICQRRQARSHEHVFSARKGGVSHTFKGISSRNNQKRIDYILIQQGHTDLPSMMQRFTPILRPPPRRTQTISLYTRWFASVAVLHPTDSCERNIKPGLSIGRRFDPTEVAYGEELSRSSPSFLPYPPSPIVSPR